MADNTLFHASLDPAMPRIADREVTHSGDTAKVQLIALAKVLGAEGAPATVEELDALDTILEAIRDRLPSALTTNGSALKAGSSEVVLTASVAAGQTLQGTGSDLAGLRNWGILVPSTFDGTEIQFQMSDTLAGTYVGVYDITNTRVKFPVSASQYTDIPGELLGVRFLKIECLTVQATTATDFLIIGKT